MKNIPKKIYLQIGEDCDCKDWNEIYPSSEITWCADNINNNDIEYKLATNDNKSIDEIEECAEMILKNLEDSHIEPAQACTEYLLKLLKDYKT
jgi:hypothetical protein